MTSSNFFENHLNRASYRGKLRSKFNTHSDFRRNAAEATLLISYFVAAYAATHQAVLVFFASGIAAIATHILLGFLIPFAVIALGYLIARLFDADATSEFIRANGASKSSDANASSERSQE